MGASILIVDDLEDHRALLARRLERLGFQIREAVDGADAVAITMNARPDVIIMDLSMPEMDGLEAWRMLQDMCDDPPPVIALTATRIRDVELACIEHGFSAFLEKPCATADLAAAINACLDKKAA